MTRAEIKQNAKELVKTNKWNIWKAYLVPMILTGLIISICNAMSLNEDSMDLVTSILSIILLPVNFGISAYVLSIVRGEEPDLSKLKEYYPVFGKIFLISVLTSLLVMLWSILLIIPGIIAAISYSMVFFVSIDNPDLTANECITKSKEIMKGHKWEFFIFQLSFIGWSLLGVCTFGILYIWLLPYMVVAETMFYEQLEK